MDNIMPESPSCGFVGIIGLPNAGKSTLVNHLAGTKISIVSPKVQTTRARALAIVMHGPAQIILIDTPGVFAPDSLMGKAMTKAAWDVLSDADVVLHLVDASSRNTLSKNKPIIDRLGEAKRAALVLNQIDKIAKPELLDLAQGFNDAFPYEQTFMISALKGRGTDTLLKFCAEAASPGPYLYDPELMTTSPLRFMAAEMTREQIYRMLHEELPYAIFVETEQWEEFNDGSVKIQQLIYVKRETQKAIVLGKGGRTIKEIGLKSRLEMEKLLERRVHLKLFVKVQENWDERAENLAAIGLGK